MKTHQQALDIAGDYDNLSDKIQAYLKERGLVAVPAEPTKSMIEEAKGNVCVWSYDELRDDFREDIYRAILAAAPNPFEGEE